MFRRSAGCILASAVLIASAAPARGQMPTIGSGDQCHDHWTSTASAGWRQDYRRNIYWPYPFVVPDRDSVAVPIGMMIAKGWERQNLMTDYLFIDGESQLTKAGQLKVRWILTQAPTKFRTIFVQRGITPEVTAARVDSIQRCVSGMFVSNEMPAIVESNMYDEGTPAEDVVQTMRQYIKTAPDPRITSGSSAGGTQMSSAQ